MSFNRLQPHDSTRVSWGIHLSFYCPELIEFFGHLGFEWLFLDAEHGPLNAQLCREIVRAADGVDMACLVRVPEAKPAVIESYLDVGVLGILVPGISTADEARALVAMTKFWPEGSRGSASKTRAANYGLTDGPADYYQKANRAVFTTALIESKEGLHNLEAILSVLGLDYVAVGPNDLGLSMGSDKGMADPEVRAAVQRAEACIRAHGKSPVTVVGNGEQAKKAMEAGDTLIAVPDVALIGGAGKAFFKQING